MIECGGDNYQPLVKAASQLEEPFPGIFLVDLSKRSIGLRSKSGRFRAACSFQGVPSVIANVYIRRRQAFKGFIEKNGWAIESSTGIQRAFLMIEHPTMKQR